MPAEDDAIKNATSFLTNVASAFKYADLLKVGMCLLSKREHLM